MEKSVKKCKLCSESNEMMKIEKAFHEISKTSTDDVNAIFLKLVEEVGELAQEFNRSKRVMENMLEEAIDVYLVSFDLILKLQNISTETDTIAIMKNKLEKWKTAIEQKSRGEYKDQ